MKKKESIYSEFEKGNNFENEIMAFNEDNDFNGYKEGDGGNDSMVFVERIRISLINFIYL